MRRVLGLIAVTVFSSGAPASEPAGESSAEGNGPTSASSFSAELTFATDYVFRGISQSENAPAVQGSFAYAHRSGFTASVWGSNVNEIVSAGGVEIDLSAGYEKLHERLAYSFGLIYYAYPGDDADRPEADYVEGSGAFEYLLSGAGLLPTLGASYFYSPQFYAEAGPVSLREPTDRRSRGSPLQR